MYPGQWHIPSIMYANNDFKLTVISTKLSLTKKSVNIKYNTIQNTNHNADNFIGIDIRNSSLVLYQ